MDAEQLLVIWAEKKGILSELLADGIIVGDRFDRSKILNLVDFDDLIKRLEHFTIVVDAPGQYGSRK